MEIKVEVKNGGIVDNFHKNASKITLGGSMGLKQIGKEFIQELSRTINEGQRTGRKYPNLPNRSSSEGEPPKTQTGRLASSGKFVANEKQVEVGETAPYASDLEFGTRRMQPRPHMSKVHLENKAEFLDIMGNNPLDVIVKTKGK